MDRRIFLKTIASLAGSALPISSVLADQNCRPTQYGPLCTSFIPLQRLGKVYAPQMMPEWCWAATISMIFGYYGHPVSQARIVRDAYGTVADMPGSDSALLGSLDRAWQDDNGDDFSVSVNNLFAPELGAGALTNADLVQTLSGEAPIVLCTAHHAMVLTSVSFVGPTVVEAWAMDPWPGNGLRRLSAPEVVPMPQGQLRMVATLSVD